MSAKISGIDRAAAELANGRAWRAKEILSGRLRNSAYDAELFRLYAKVLNAMGDDNEDPAFSCSRVIAMVRPES